jgi:hypothetical protein
MRSLTLLMNRCPIAFQTHQGDVQSRLPQLSPFLFKRALLEAIRLAVSEAHIRGEIDVEVTVSILGALPVA